MQAIQSIAAQYLAEELVDFKVRFQQRPDGALVLELRDQRGKRLVRRAIDREELCNGEFLRTLVERIRRDLILESGPLQEGQAMQFKHGSELPSFIPNQPRRERKVVMAGARLQARCRA
ncbi:hypothetical protein D9M68_155640 [compost metagenome]